MSDAAGREPPASAGRAARVRRDDAADRVARDYDRLRPEVVRTVAGKLAAAGVEVADADLDAAYNAAWHAVYVKLAAGEEVGNLVGLLVTVTHRRALDDHRAQQPQRRAAPERLEMVPAPDVADARLDDLAQLRQVIATLRVRLDGRELEAAALCYVHGCSRREAARLLGVPPKRMEKIMDGVARRLAPLLGAIRGRLVRGARLADPRLCARAAGARRPAPPGRPRPPRKVRRLPAHGAAAARPAPSAPPPPPPVRDGAEEFELQ